MSKNGVSGEKTKEGQTDRTREINDKHGTSASKKLRFSHATPSRWVKYNSGTTSSILVVRRNWKKIKGNSCAYQPLTQESTFTIQKHTKKYNVVTIQGVIGESKIWARALYILGKTEGEKGLSIHYQKGTLSKKGGGSS